jgi:hypothetical protein
LFNISLNIPVKNILPENIPGRVRSLSERIFTIHNDVTNSVSFLEMDNKIKNYQIKKNTLTKTTTIYDLSPSRL